MMAILSAGAKEETVPRLLLVLLLAKRLTLNPIETSLHC